MVSKVYTKMFQRFNPYSAGIDFSRQTLTKVDHRTGTVNIFLMAVDP